MYDIGVLFSNSGKFRDLYQSIDNNKTRFKYMCPTRWTVRCKVISAVLHNYLDIINALEQLTMARRNSTELIAKAYSYKNTLLETSTYISLNIAFDIFTLLEKLVSVTYSLY